MKNKQEIDCIFRKVRSFKKYVKCKRRDRVKAKLKPFITTHMTAFSLLLSFGKWAFFPPTDCLHFCTLDAAAFFFLILVFARVVATLILCQGAKK